MRTCLACTRPWAQSLSQKRLGGKDGGRGKKSPFFPETREWSWKSYLSLQKGDSKGHRQTSVWAGADRSSVVLSLLEQRCWPKIFWPRHLRNHAPQRLELKGILSTARSTSNKVFISLNCLLDLLWRYKKQCIFLTLLFFFFNLDNWKKLFACGVFPGHLLREFPTQDAVSRPVLSYRSPSA